MVQHSKEGEGGGDKNWCWDSSESQKTPGQTARAVRLGKLAVSVQS